MHYRLTHRPLLIAFLAIVCIQVCVSSIPYGAVKCPAGSTQYKVMRGDSCSSILAKKFQKAAAKQKTSAAALYVKYNQAPCSSLYVGKVICVPASWAVISTQNSFVRVPRKQLPFSCWNAFSKGYHCTYMESNCKMLFYAPYVPATLSCSGYG